MSPEATALRLSQWVWRLGEGGRNTKERLTLAARRAQLTWRQAKAIFYRERGVDAHVAERIEAALLEYLADQVRRAEAELAAARAASNQARLSDLAAQAERLARDIAAARGEP